MRASGASELRKLSYFHIQKLQFPSIFCWNFRYFVSETFIFRAQIPSAFIYTQSMQFPFYHLWYDAIYKRQYTDKTLTLRKCMYLRASGASELRKFPHFHIFKLLFPSIFCWYCRYFVSETYLFSGVNNICIHIYTINAVSFLSLISFSFFSFHLFLQLFIFFLKQIQMKNTNFKYTI